MPLRKPGDLSYDVSIVIPAKDEAQRLPGFLHTVIEYCGSSTLKYEIIVVDDGSGDETAASASAFQKDFADLRVLRLVINKGKGHAVKQGFLASQGAIVLFMDADGSTGPQEIEKNLHFFEEGYDIVIGSRVVNDQGAVVKTRLYRQFMRVLLGILVQTFLIKGIWDTQCGFKMFRAGLIGPVFGRLKIDGYGFDLETLYLARQLGFRTKEVRVNWHHVSGSKVNFVKDSWCIFRNIFEIKKRHSAVK